MNRKQNQKFSHFPHMNHTAKKAASTLVLLFMLLLPVMQAQEWLKYEVAVEALIIPVFAMDKKGDPVLDLKKEELTLMVDGKPVDISYFKAFKYILNEEDAQAEMVPVDEKKKQRRSTPPPERIIFIVVDTIFNSAAGIMRSRHIASELIKKAPPTDRFILIEFNPGSGLVYRGGPNIKREKLLAQVKSITPQQNMWASMRNRLANDEAGNSMQMTQAPATPESRTTARLQINNRKVTQSYLGNNVNPIGMESELEPDVTSQMATASAYRGSMKRFSNSLTQLKYALKTITKPKIVFMISEGMVRGALQTGGIGTYIPGSSITKNNYFQGYMLDYLKKVVQAINEGGSLMYTINPKVEKSQPDIDQDGESTLKYLAHETGGKYFTGRDTKKVIKHIRNTTTAYYEVAFHIPRSIANQFDIRFKCKRKGIKLHTLNRSERNRSYSDMNKVQRKVFAIDAVRGGNWSRMVGRIVKVAFRNIKDTNKEKTVGITLSDSMRNIPLDIFTIYLDENSENVELEMETKKCLSSLLNVKVKKKEKKVSCVLVIEPKTTNCIYNKV